MKLLLDENLPHQMRLELPNHEIFTAAYMKWNRIENGELLRLAAEAGFDAVITNDRGLEYEQNLHELPVAGGRDLGKNKYNRGHPTSL